MRFLHFFLNFLAALLLLANFPAGAQAWQWAKGVSQNTTFPAPFVGTSATAVTQNGEVYAAYTHRGPITLGAFNLSGIPAVTMTSDCNAALAHHDQAGNVTALLLQVKGGAVSDVYLDTTGNIYASGYFHRQLRSGNTILQPTDSATTDDIFLAKWNSTGSLQWIRTGQTGISWAYPGKLVVDGTGNITLTCSFLGSCTFGGQSVYSPSTAMLLVQYTATGQLNWLRFSSSPNGTVVPGGTAIAADGSLYVSGCHSFSSMNWQGVPLNTSANRCGFLLKVSSTGQLLQHIPFGNRNNNYQSQVAIDSQGAIYVASTSNSPQYWWSTRALFSLPARSRLGIFVFKLNPNGVPCWARTVSMPDSTGAELQLTRMAIVGGRAESGAAEIFIGGNFRSLTGSTQLQCGDLALTNSVGTLNMNAFLLKLEGSTGQPVWLRPAAQSAGFDQLYSLNANATGHLSLGGYFTGDTASFGGIRLLNPASRQITAFTAKMVRDYNVLHGQAFRDHNGNGMLDAGESGVGGIIVEVTPGHSYSTTSSTGIYQAIAQLGNYSLSLPNPPPYYSAVPIGPPTNTFTTYGNIAQGRSFALQPIANQQDLRVYLTPVGRARPGFAVKYRATVKNIGTVPVANATLQFTADPLLTLVSVTPLLPTPGPGPGWGIGTLAPGETREVDFLFQLAITAPLGHVLNAIATIEPTTGDLTPTDNTETATLTVTGSYDPNDISVNYASLTLPQVRNATKALDYTIRFQNMGTDTAFTALIIDTLPADVLNLGTLQLLSASHTCIWRLAPGGVLVVEFPNILLPDRTTNTLRSMGFVRFRVVPRVTLAAGDLIPNAANIHFDYSPPVTTNTALTTVVSSNGLPEETAATDLRIWPNPTSGVLNVEVAAETGEVVKLTLLDALGRTALTEAHRGSARQTLDVRGLPGGLYLLRATAGGRQWSRRVVVR